MGIVGCQGLVDGDTMLGNWPSVSCDERGVALPLAIVGTILWCVGIPLMLAGAVYAWHTHKLKTHLQGFLLRNIFCGHKGTIKGFVWRVAGMLRTFLIVFVAL